jgi:glyoxylase-like metal-dependent hydrolase (beta-lactamase superfamily II)
MATFRVSDELYGIDFEMFDTEVLSGYVIDADDPVLIETGYPHGVGRLRDGLESVGVPSSELAHAVISHVHIDHSGGAALLVEDNPDLNVYIHEATADHLVDPAELTESSRDAMGGHFEEMGEPDPVPPSNVIRVDDERTDIDAGDRTISLLSTPGHSPDHLSAWDPASGTMFANEAVGSYYPRSGRWLPPSTLPRFDIEAVRASIDRLREFDGDRLALSHFGVRPDPDAALDEATETLDTFERRIPKLYREHDENASATERAVRAKLVALDGYADAIESFETRFQTRGFLRYAGLL